MIISVDKFSVGNQEQFTTDWDYVRRYQDPFSQDYPTAPISRIDDPTTIAGTYGEWSNVWQIGMVRIST